MWQQWSGAAQQAAAACSQARGTDRIDEVHDKNMQSYKMGRADAAHFEPDARR